MTLTDAIHEMKYNAMPAVRREAAKYINESDQINQYSIDALIYGLIDTDPGVKDYCSRALSNLSNENAIYAADKISSLITSADIELRNLAADILIKLGPVSLSSLLPFLQSDDSRIRQFACFIGGKLNNKDIIPKIFELLDDNDDNVLSAAVEAAGNLEDFKFLDKLISMIDRSYDLKPMIIEAIGKIGGHGVKELLLELLLKEEDVFIKTAIIDAMSLCCSDPEFIPWLIGNLNDQPDEARYIIIKAIYAISSRNDYIYELPAEYRFVARNALFHYDPDIRSAGLLALGNYYDIDDVPGLVNEARFNNPETQHHILINLLENSDDSVIRSFFQVIFNFTNPDSTNLDLVSYIPHIWMKTNIKNAQAIIEILVDLVLSSNWGRAGELLDILVGLNNDAVKSRLNYYIEFGSQEQKDEAFELLSQCSQ